MNIGLMDNRMIRLIVKQIFLAELGIHDSKHVPSGFTDRKFVQPCGTSGQFIDSGEPVEKSAKYDGEMDWCNSLIIFLDPFKP